MARRAATTDASGLTARERELLVLVSKGFRVSEAAAYIHLSKHTLASHMKSILTKLQASTQAEAVYKAVKEGVIE